MAGPLAGVRIVDLTRYIAGPFGTQILGDQGAGVIKVEPPLIGDVLRYIGSNRNGVSGYFLCSNRAKRSITLDLENREGCAVLHALIASADVLVQNFRAGVMERLGFSYDAVRQYNPNIIYVSVDGFGPDGPFAGLPAFDQLAQAMTGYAAVQSDAANDKLDMVRTAVCDKVTAMNAAQATTAALFARERGAGGQHIHISLHESGLYFAWPDVMSNHILLGDGVVEQAEMSALYAICKTRDGHVVYAPQSEAHFWQVAEAFGRAALRDDPRYTPGAFLAPGTVDFLFAGLGDAFAEFSTDAVIARIRELDVPVAPVLWREDIANHPQVTGAGLLVERTHAQAGRYRQPRPPAIFSKTSTPPGSDAPALGQHTEQILTELGYDDARIKALRETGALG